MSTTSFAPGPVPTPTYYTLDRALEIPFSFTFSAEDYDFGSTFSPDMSRYLKSPTPSQEQEASHQPHAHTTQMQSPNSYDMGNLSLHSPPGPTPERNGHSQPIPINQPSYVPAGHDYGAGASSSLPHRNGFHQTYHPYARPDQSHHLYRSPPGSSHSATSGPLSSVLVSPTSDQADMSPLPISYYGHPQYVASPLTAHMAGMSPGDQQPRGLPLPMGGNGSMGLGMDLGGGYGAGGMYFAPQAQMGWGQGQGQMPQYPPGSSTVRGRGRGRGGKAGGGKGVKRRVSGEGVVKQEEEDEDEDAEGESVLEDIGTHKSNLEKHRRQVIKGKFFALAQALGPIEGGNGKGSTKVNTLDRATARIEQLTSGINTISQQSRDLHELLCREREAHAETMRLNAELSRALAAVRTSPGGKTGPSPPA